jgi:hypothetical protein
MYPVESEILTLYTDFLQGFNPGRGKREELGWKKKTH